MIEYLAIALGPVWWWVKRNKWYFVAAGAALLVGLLI